jgi:hypothetical protein
VIFVRFNREKIYIGWYRNLLVFDLFNMLQLFSAVNCWLKCMLLEPYNQTDHPECKSRPDSGLSAITELDPGYITGKLKLTWFAKH